MGLRGVLLNSGIAGRSAGFSTDDLPASPFGAINFTFRRNDWRFLSVGGPRAGWKKLPFLRAKAKFTPRVKGLFDEGDAR